MTKMLDTDKLKGRKINVDFELWGSKKQQMPAFLQRRRWRAERRIRRAL